MIVTPTDPHQWRSMAGMLLAQAGVQPQHDMLMFGWISEQKLQVVVAFTSFLGKTAQIHVAFADGWKFAPREMIGSIFRFAFEQQKLEMLIGIVNSKNEPALKFDQRLGFKEIFRLPGLHDDGGDIVILGMRKEECPYLNEPKLEGEETMRIRGHG